MDQDMDNIQIQGGAFTQQQHLEVQSQSESSGYENFDKASPVHQENVQNEEQSNNRRQQELGGIAFDHGRLPKIIAVHTIKNRSRMPFPKNLELSYSPLMKNQEMLRNRDNMQHAMPPMPAYPDEMPNSRPVMPQSLIYYSHNQEGLRSNSFNGAIYPQQMPVLQQRPDNYIPPLQRQHSLDSNTILSEEHHSSAALHPALRHNMQEIDAIRSIGEKLHTISHRPFSEPPKLLPISANIHSSPNQAIQGTTSRTYTNTEHHVLAEQNHQNHQPPYNISVFPERLPFHNTPPCFQAAPHFHNPQPHNQTRPSFYDAPRHNERGLPFHNMPAHNQAGLHGSISTIRFPYDRYPINMQQLSPPFRQYTQPSYQNTVASQLPYPNTIHKHQSYQNQMPIQAPYPYATPTKPSYENAFSSPTSNQSTPPTQFPYPNANQIASCYGSQEEAQMPSMNTSKARRHSSNILRSRQGKPYQRTKSADYTYADLLKLENKCDLLHLLKLGADQGRLNLICIVQKLLADNVIENSLCLLESLKSSDLTEKTKERILSVVEEIIWKAPPREDFWQSKDIVPTQINETVNFDDTEFESQQQQYFDELVNSAIPRSDTDSIVPNIESNLNSDVPDSCEDSLGDAVNKVSSQSQCLSGGYASVKTEIPSPKLNGASLDPCGNPEKCNNKENSPANGFCIPENDIQRMRINSVDSFTGEKIFEVEVTDENGQVTTGNLKILESEVFKDKLGDSVLPEEFNIKIPIVVKKEPVDDYPCEEQNENLCKSENSFTGNVAMVKTEPTENSPCMKGEKMNTGIKERFQNNNYVVRNIFDLFT